MSAEPTSLVDECRRFLLASSKNTEQFGPDLLAAISVPTELDAILTAAVAARRDTVVAGTAGSGKTHLLSVLEKNLGSRLPLVEYDEEPPTNLPFVRVIADLTAVPIKDRVDLFHRPAGCVAVIVCANEGTLLAAARDAPAGITPEYARSVDSLHRIQRGDVVSNLNEPVLVDAAGYDPTAGDTLIGMLGNDLLKLTVDRHSHCACALESCYRRRAWRLLDSREVRARIARLVGAAALDAEGFTFRMLWNFVADLALGGTCEGHSPEAVPTSPWFWRVFHGDSVVSQRIATLFPPLTVPLPQSDGRLWYGDWAWVWSANRLVDDVDIKPLIPPRRPSDGGSAISPLFEWVKVQSLFCLRADPLASVREDVPRSVEIRS